MSSLYEKLILDYIKNKMKNTSKEINHYIKIVKNSQRKNSFENNDLKFREDLYLKNLSDIEGN